MPARKTRGRRKKLQTPRQWLIGGAALLLFAGLYLLHINPQWTARLPGGEQISAVLAELYGDGELSPQPLFPDGTAQELPEGQFELHMIDVGQALSVLLRAPDGECALIDAGNRGDEERICPYLKSLGLERLDYLIATHMHADHIGGMDEVVKEFSIGRVILPDTPEEITPTTKSYTDLLSAISDKGYRITLAKPGAKYPLGKAQLSILGPVQDYEDLNNTSVVARVDYGAVSFLVTGDAEKTAEQDMLDSRRVQPANVLIAGHHGSSTASSAAFLSAVRPAYIGISCGEGNSYGHPHKEAIERMQKIGSTILRTDLYGTVIFYTDGQALGAQVERNS